MHGLLIAKMVTFVKLFTYLWTSRISHNISLAHDNSRMYTISVTKKNKIFKHHFDLFFFNSDTIIAIANKKQITPTHNSMERSLFAPVSRTEEPGLSGE